MSVVTTQPGVWRGAAGTIQRIGLALAAAAGAKVSFPQRPTKFPH
ncbi:MAG TPA: hypothetical protein VFA16_22500 [Mycobacterium sp.]|nr:hypothetical protein [Mycobacterium sp.]HZU49998.1 hypothetical protein [Mycobacterium sp.]